VDRFLPGRHAAVGVLIFVVVGLTATLSMAKDGESSIESASKMTRHPAPERPAEAVAAIARLRNPDNAPEDWMRPILAEYLDSEPSPGSFRTVDLGSRGIATIEPI